MPQKFQIYWNLPLETNHDNTSCTIWGGSEKHLKRKAVFHSNSMKMLDERKVGEKHWKSKIIFLHRNNCKLDAKIDFDNFNLCRKYNTIKNLILQYYILKSELWNDAVISKDIFGKIEKQNTVLKREALLKCHGDLSIL